MIHQFIIIGSAVLLLLFLVAVVQNALRAITPAEISSFKEFHPGVASILDRIKENMSCISITLSMVTIPVIIYGMYQGCLLSQRYPLRYSVTAMILYTYLLIFTGIVVPQHLGKRHRETIAFLSAFPIRILTWLLFPLTGLLLGMEKVFFRHGTHSKQKIKEELIHIAAIAQKTGAISREQAHLITRSIEFSSFTAADIMVPGKDIHVISDSLSLNEALVEAHLHHHTRFPLIHDNNINQITGYVNFKDIVGALRINPSDPSLYGIKRPIESVLSSTPLPQLLHLLTRGYRHIVIVKDENDNTRGMVTLEDIMETLLGNLEDEYDTPPTFLIQLAENRYCAGGGARFTDLKNKIPSTIPDWNITIDEWLNGQVEGKLPEQFTTTYQDLTFQVRKIARGKVFDTIIRHVPHD